MIYEIEFFHEGEWHFHHQTPRKETADLDASEYAELLKTPFRARLRTPEEEAALS